MELPHPGRGAGPLSRRQRAQPSPNTAVLQSSACLTRYGTLASLMKLYGDLTRTLLLAKLVQVIIH